MRLVTLGALGAQATITAEIRRPVHTAASPGDPDRIFIVDHRHEVLEETVDPTNPNRVNPAIPPRTIITIVHPDDQARGHHGGWIGFDPAGNLFVTVGDGDAKPFDDVSQDLSNPFGAVLRIRPVALSDPASLNGDLANNFTVPADNPFVGEPGLDEIYAYGLRNPFRGSIDPVTGLLIVSDVGEDSFEEVDVVRPGDNFGWPGFEGTEPFPGSPLAEEPDPVADPLFVRAHSESPFNALALVGGPIYRGDIAALKGRYFFIDFAFARIGSITIAPDAVSFSDPI
ncbi:MAG: PQQ-dependent sugar dehydrogenase [Pseudomonadota bacterium]